MCPVRMVMQLPAADQDQDQKKESLRDVQLQSLLLAAGPRQVSGCSEQSSGPG